MTEDLVKGKLAAAIQLTGQVIKATDAAASFKQDCAELKSRAEKLSVLLRQAARASSDLYERPAHRIIEDCKSVLDKTLLLVLKCVGHGIVKRVFTLIPPAAFRKASSQLDNSIADVSWILRVSSSAGEGDDDYFGLPPIAQSEPMLHLVWQQIALLSKGSPYDRTDAAASLVSLARDSDRNAKLIIEEGGVGPLLKLLKEGKLEGQENAARAIGLLGKKAETVEHMIRDGVCSVFAKILKEGQMKVQAVVAWAVAELVSHHPQCQDHFAQHNVIRLLVSHLCFETVPEHTKYEVASKAMSMHAAVVLASSEMNSKNVTTPSDLDGGDKSLIRHSLGLGDTNCSQMYDVVASKVAAESVGRGSSTAHGHHHHIQSRANSKAREMEDPASKAYMKAMASRALWLLARGNPSICRSITESRALLCYAFLMEKGTGEVRYNSAMALLEITVVAEGNPKLRKSAFKPNSVACKAVVDQILSVIEKQDPELLIPCIMSIGNLSRTFKSTETRMISPLVKLLDQREAQEEVSREACIALTKFARRENYLHIQHSQAILASGGAKHLVPLVYFGGQMLQKLALVLVSYVAMHAPDSEELEKAEVLKVLEWASRQTALMQIEETEKLVMEAKGKLELYRSR